MNWRAISLLFGVACALCACPGEPAPPEVFPADYAASYVEVRDCRRSGDHDLNYIRVLADPASSGPYMSRAEPFPVGSIILKEEYDFVDGECAGDISQWTVMIRLPTDSSPETLDWQWYQVSRDGDILGEDTPRCYGCHATCEPGGVGYLGTCAEP